MKRQNGGFTLVEVLVVLAILAILVAVAAPALRGAAESTHKTICAYHVKECSNLYLLARALTGGETPEETMARVLTGSMGGTETAEGYAGICPSDGFYSIKLQDGEAVVYCQKHQITGSGGTGTFSAYQGIQMLLDLDVKLTDAAGREVSDGSLLDYLRWKARLSAAGAAFTIDSQADHLGERTIARQVEAALQAADSSVDFSSVSWRVYYRKGATQDKDEYTISWCDEDISKLSPGSPITVTRYDTARGVYQVTASGQVTEKVQDGKRYKIIDIGGVTDWKEIEP